MTSLLNFRPKDALSQFLDECKKLNCNADTDYIKTVAESQINYLRSNRKDEQIPEIIMKEQKYWYETIAKNDPDWKVYDSDYYLGELWACWIVYSRRYLSMLAKSEIIKDRNSIRKAIDLGCGCGYTTAVLKEIFPNAEVIGTNLEDTKQIKFARLMGEKNNFKIVSDIKQIESPVDIVFASEYFEHILSPVEHLKNILYLLKPNILIIANSFGTKSVGHFDFYLIDRRWTNERLISKKFSSQLKESGFVKLRTGFWNDRPSFWKRMEPRYD